jgi:hypothetical protein
VTPIRPTGLPNTGPAQGTGRPDVARTAAQKAFFQAALGQTAQPMAPRPESVSAAAAPRAQRIPTNLPADPPERILRPGSLLDIRV